MKYDEQVQREHTIRVAYFWAGFVAGFLTMVLTAA